MKINLIPDAEQADKSQEGERTQMEKARKKPKVGKAKTAAVRNKVAKSPGISKAKIAITRPRKRKPPKETELAWPAWVPGFSMGLAASLLIVGGSYWSSRPPSGAPVQAPRVPATASTSAPAVARTVIPSPSPSPSPVMTKPAQQQHALTEGPFHREFEALQSKTLGEKIAFWSEYLVKTPGFERKLRTLDAPAIQDSAPLLPDKYDCTTFVETVSALSRSRDHREFFAHLIEIRYKGGKTTFFGRNHFPEADWIPNNVNAGILKDITASVSTAAGVETGLERKLINRAKWFSSLVAKQKLSRSIASTSPDAWPETEEVSIRYVPLSEIEKVVEKIPDGAILNLVRRNHSAQPVLITHQGLVVREKGKVMLRHALPGGRVRNVELLG